MKRFVIALSTFIGVSGTAIAADLPVRAPAMGAPVPYNWTGCYIGAAGGGAWGSSKHVSGDPGDAGLAITNRYSMTGGIVGVEYGCNWQTGRFLLGSESDFSFTNLRG